MFLYLKIIIISSCSKKVTSSDCSQSEILHVWVWKLPIFSYLRVYKMLVATFQTRDKQSNWIHHSFFWFCYICNIYFYFSLVIIVQLWASSENLCDGPLSKSLYTVSFPQQFFYLIFVIWFQLNNIGWCICRAADPGAVETNIMRELPKPISKLATASLRQTHLLGTPQVGVSSIIDAALAPPVSN